MNNSIAWTKKFAVIHVYFYGSFEVEDRTYFKQYSKSPHII